MAIVSLVATGFLFIEGSRAIGHPRPGGESGRPDSAAHGDKRQAPGRSR
jgi:hypothetical protein